MTKLRFAFLIAVALPLAGCGNKGPLVLAPRSEAPPPTPGERASEAVAAPSTVTAPADPTGSSQTVQQPSVLPAPSTSAQPPAPSTVAPPPPADDTDGSPGTPR
ncbi:lipoprotein [Lysobacter sp. KIS68-7]|uniref:LPS translocon maturation chaperone LptM n=1 Tax=Lysobacter sp. KIS68-7 TaxID=2904252 RepID=UPI001E4F8571|nr:lipoprotein [Lysobacter sp. KIS68-7]UHQ20272.1 lipoprotein [Lysobacter sp. KIS68-7]